MIYKDVCNLAESSDRNCYYLSTDDGYVISAVKKGLKLFLSRGGEFEIEIYDDTDTMQFILQKIMTVSMFSDRKLVIIERYSKKLKDADVKALKAYLSEPLEERFLLIITDTASKTFQPFKNQLLTFDFKINPFLLKEEALGYFSERNISINSTALNELVSLSAADAGYCMNEVEKLCCYAADKKTVDLQDVKNVVRKNFDGSIYKIVNALTVNDYKGAVDELNYFLSAGEKPSVIINSITSVYRRAFFVSLNKGESQDKLRDLCL